VIDNTYVPLPRVAANNGACGHDMLAQTVDMGICKDSTSHRRRDRVTYYKLATARSFESTNVIDL